MDFVYIRFYNFIKPQIHQYLSSFIYIYIVFDFCDFCYLMRHRKILFKKKRISLYFTITSNQ